MPLHNLLWARDITVRKMISNTHVLFSIPLNVIPVSTLKFESVRVHPESQRIDVLFKSIRAEEHLPTKQCQGDPGVCGKDPRSERKFWAMV